MASESPDSTRTMFLAMDGSEHSNYAFEYYKKNIHKDGDRVILAHCAESIYYPSPHLRASNPRAVHEYIEEQKARIKAVQEKLETKLKESKLTGIVKTLHGHPGDAVVKAAKEEDAAAIICGTRGMGVIRRTVLGSVSDHILHHSHVPVLVCKHPDHLDEHQKHSD